MQQSAAAPPRAPHTPACCPAPQHGRALPPHLPAPTAGAPPSPPPCSRLLFDAVGGVADCEARRLRTICPPDESLTKDPARILRGLRLAARAGELG